MSETHLRRLLRALPSVCLAMGMICFAGQLIAEDATPTVSALPNAPSTLLLDPNAAIPFLSNKPKPDVAPKYQRVIAVGQKAVPLSSSDKFALAIKDRMSLSSVAGSAFSAAYGYVTDGSPHYGVNAPAFGERFGAAELRATSESIFSYGLYASLFHDDPRYYVMGSRESFTKRAVYSATRVVVTRKDDGSNAVNWSKLAGLTSAGALSNAYYPDRDRTVGRTASSVLTSIATTAGTNELHEFLGDAMHLLFHRHTDAAGK